tara:strand:- start:602 stop:820 length:219 start_codon:yes stop_codon:yes gene_type:complete
MKNVYLYYFLKLLKIIFRKKLFKNGWIDNNFYQNSLNVDYNSFKIIKMNNIKQDIKYKNKLEKKEMDIYPMN